jgi:hypothetical protein
MHEKPEPYLITDNSDSTQAWALRGKQAAAIQRTTGLSLNSVWDCDGARGFALKANGPDGQVLVALEWDDCSHDLYLLVEALELYLTFIDPAEA